MVIQFLDTWAELFGEFVVLKEQNFVHFEPICCVTDLLFPGLEALIKVIT